MCAVKYASMSLNERGLHKMLKKMNQSVVDYQKNEDLKNSPEPKYYQWYSDLEYLVESNYSREDVVLGKILEKLSAYGKVFNLFGSFLHISRLIRTLN